MRYLCFFFGCCSENQLLILNWMQSSRYHMRLWCFKCFLAGNYYFVLYRCWFENYADTFQVIWGQGHDWQFSYLFVLFHVWEVHYSCILASSGVYWLKKKCILHWMLFVIIGCCVLCAINDMLDKDWLLSFLDVAVETKWPLLYWHIYSIRYCSIPTR